MYNGNTGARTRGQTFTTPFWLLWLLSLVGLYFVVIRFTKGIGAVSNLSDGYPWGIWVAYDVGLGTALACGGYAVSILTFILNRWRYDPLVGSAILTSLFGSCLAAFSVVVDIGRPWNAYGFFVPTRWQPTSAFFELALCIAAYLLAKTIELFPRWLATGDGGKGFPRKVLLRLLPRNFVAGMPAPHLYRRLNRALICITAAGIVLPTMHQSALGSLMLIASTKLHPLWHTPFLPLLFLINCIYIGFAIVILQSVASSFLLARDYRRDELAALGGLVPWLTSAWLVIRVGDLIKRDQLSALFHGDFYSGFFLIEFFLMACGTLPLFSAEKRRSPRWLFICAALMLSGGGLYRFNVYLIGFNPGRGWHYFPSFAEVMISVGIVSWEILFYRLLQRFLRTPSTRGSGIEALH